MTLNLAIVQEKTDFSTAQKGVKSGMGTHSPRRKPSTRTMNLKSSALLESNNADLDVVA